MWRNSLRSTTFITSTSLLSCFVICSIIASDPEVTTVIRETVESSVGATIRDSILNALAENKPETLDNAPASFSISKESI